MRWAAVWAACIGLGLAVPAEAKTPAVGEQIPHFVLRTMNPKLSGEKLVATKRIVGKKAKPAPRRLVLTFAASYCEPCKKELAQLRTLVDKIEAKNATLATVVVDKEAEGIEAMKKLVTDELGVKFPVASDRMGLVARRWGVEKLPMLVVVGEDGTVKWMHIGFKPEALDEMMAQL